MMTRNVLFLCLCSFYWLALVGCAPTSEPLAATRLPVAQTTATLPAASETATQSATSTFAPTATEAWQTRAAHLTSLPLPPSETPTVTDTPTPTFTPYPGPVWRIQFRGKACPDLSQNSGDCSKYSSALDFTPSTDYFINSDGNGFSTLEEAGSFLVNYGTFYLFPESFSPDGLQIAFATSNCVYVSDLAGKNPVCLIPDDFPASYRFSPDGSCLLAVFRILEEEASFAQVRVQKHCRGQEASEMIGIFDFADLPDRPVNYALSPQGDALLAHGRMPDGELRLYVQEINPPTAPLLLFSYPNEDLTARIVEFRWHLDGRVIEFLLDSQPQNTFYRVGRDGRDLTSIIQLPPQFQAQLGDWSPDGQEFAFSHVEEDGTKSGLYVIDLRTGEWRQLLSGFHINWRVRGWLDGMP